MKEPNKFHLTCPCCNEKLVVKMEAEAETCDPDARDKYNKKVSKETMDKYGINDKFVRDLIEKNSGIIEPVRKIRDMFDIGLIRAKGIVDLVKVQLEQEKEAPKEDSWKGGGI